MNPHTQGKGIIIVGTHQSGKTTELVKQLRRDENRLWTNGNYLIVKHPNADHDTPGKLGNYDAVVTDDVLLLAGLVSPETSDVFIDGINHFGPEIVHFYDALLMSNRSCMGTGTPLDDQGKPFGSMGPLLAYADEVWKESDFCTVCDRESSRSKKVDDGWEPRCIDHFADVEKKFDQKGLVRIITGEMFSGKSEDLYKVLHKWTKRGKLDKSVIFEYLGHARYQQRGSERVLFGPGKMLTHSDFSAPSVLVETADHIAQYLDAHPHINRAIIEEAQFIKPGKNSLFDTVSLLASQGYRLTLAGLQRDFRRELFGEMGNLMCLADELTINHAYCASKKVDYLHNRKVKTLCNHPASENQRIMKVGSVWVPAPYDDPQEKPGGDAKKDGTDFGYIPVCRQCFRMDDGPAPLFEFERYEGR